MTAVIMLNDGAKMEALKLAKNGRVGKSTTTQNSIVLLVGKGTPLGGKTEKDMTAVVMPNYGVKMEALKLAKNGRVGKSTTTQNSIVLLVGRRLPHPPPQPQP